MIEMNKNMTSKNITIVVIDDDAEIRDSLTDLLEMEHWDCLVAENGQKGSASDDKV